MRLTTFASGSSGNCALLSMNGVHLLLDAGISYRKIKDNLALSGLKPEDLSAVLITHEHSDHVGGLSTMLKHCNVPICAPRTVAGRLRAAIPEADRCLRVIPVGELWELDGLRLRAFHTPHDTEESIGWRMEGSEVFALATDMGCVTAEVRDGLAGAETVLIEANHDVELLRSGPYPAALKRRILSDHGHLSNEDCGALAAALSDSGARQIVLGHLSRENNTPERAFRTVREALGDRDTALYVAPAAERFTLEWERETPCLL